MGKRRKKDKKRKRKQSATNGVPKTPMAETADRYDLYLRSVQAPDVDAEFFDKLYREYFDEDARVLREDFCGTASVCCEWVKLNPENRAFGVDLDPEPLSWGVSNNLARLSDTERQRIHLIEGDVNTAKSPAADVVAAQNFSYCLFKTREGLRKYFQAARSQVADQGLLVLDLFGGYESMEDDREDITEYDGFDYVWEQAKFDPITHDAEFHIHFRFKDKSKLERAFTYHWRLWSIPEVREILLEAGFSRADVYWEGTDEDGEGNGIFEKATKGDCDPAWNAYIVGVK